MKRLLSSHIKKWLRMHAPQETECIRHEIEPNTESDPLFSQKGQVRFVLHNCFDYENNGLKRNGFFVDLAAAHPKRLSNTYFLEKKLSWNGILIEANPYFAQLLREQRSTIVVESAIASQTGLVARFRIDNNELGGLVGDSYDNNPNTRGDQLKKASIIEVETMTLMEVLDTHNAPFLMDYLSLDIEGAEWEALKNFDFDKYKWKCLTIERPPLDLDLLLDENGYIQVHHVQYDTFYIHKDFIAAANLTSLNRDFRHTPRKMW